jgi:hypothetical protein
MVKSASQIIRELETRVSDLENRGENKTASYILSTMIMQVFMDKISINASDRYLSEDEREARRVLISELMREVLVLVKDHQSKVKATSKNLFDLANYISKLGS